jgi:hypothetical protein
MAGGEHPSRQKQWLSGLKLLIEGPQHTAKLQQQTVHDRSSVVEVQVGTGRSLATSVAGNGTGNGDGAGG